MISFIAFNFDSFIALAFTSLNLVPQCLAALSQYNQTIQVNCHKVVWIIFILWL
jgi:hypothetical protein